VRDATGSAADFNTTTNIAEVTPSLFSNFDLTGKFNDGAAPSPMNIIVTHNEYAWNTPGNTKYVIWEYKIKNNAATALNNFFAGVFADWDIDGTTFAQNKADYDAGNKMGYIYHTAANGLFAGIKLLTSTAPPNFYALDNAAGGGGGVDANTGGFSTAEKYTALSTQRLQSSNNVDAMEVMGSGPFTIAAGDTIVVAFALLAGDNLTDLQSSAVNAQIMYDGIVLGLPSLISANGLSLYPNPVKDNFTIDFGSAIDKGVVIVCDVLGKEVLRREVSGNSVSIATEGMPSGTYICKLLSREKSGVKKFVIER
jgi:hypothetical protein